MNIFGKISGPLGASLMAGAIACKAGDQIQVYTVPKEHPSTSLAQAQTPPAMSGSDIPVNAAPITWTLPSGWEEKPADNIRLGSFAIAGPNGGHADLVITSFPGPVGTELANVNRWRGELSLPPVETSLTEPVTVDSSEGKLFDIDGGAARTVVAMVPRNGSTWFIKLRGDAATVAAAKPVFMEFLKSVRFGGGAPAVDPHDGLGISTTSAPNPHDGLATTDASAGEPRWNVPAQWIETAPSSGMIFKSFSASDDKGAKADVTVSFLLGQGGGLLANVNRWRGQMGQAPVEADQLASLAVSLPTVAGPATLVDIPGTDVKTGQPGRLIAVIVPNGDKTWFYKLMGGSSAVEAQKNTFVEFAKTVQYP